MAANDEDRYVVPNRARGGWDVIKEHAKRASAHFDTQADAIARAREIVAKTGRGLGDVRIQSLNGKFRDAESGARNESKARDRR